MTTKASETPPAGDSRAVGRALDLLKVVCNLGSVNLADAARAAELPKSTAIRLLKKLESAGFVERNDSAVYSPGPTLIGLGAQALNRNEIVRRARPVMEELAVSTGESMYLSVRRPDDSCIYIASAQGTHPVRYETWVGRTFSVQGTAAGAILRGERPLIGFAATPGGVSPDVTHIATGIEIAGEVVAALSTLIPSYRLDPERIALIGRQLTDAAPRIAIPGFEQAGEH